MFRFDFRKPLVTTKVSTLKSKAKAKKKAISAQLAKEDAEKLQKISREHSLTQLLMAHLEMYVAVGAPDKVRHLHNLISFISYWFL